MKKVFIKRHHPGHSWFFSNEVEKPAEDIAPGEIVDIFKKNRYLGRGFYNPHSLIRVRRYSREPEDFDGEFVARVISRALKYRRQFMNENSFRLVHSEVDGLPGTIIDKYEENFVIQIHCFGVDRRKEIIVNELVKYNPGFIYEKDDLYLRSLEGLKSESRLLYGKKEKSLIITQDGLQFYVDIERGQKTGFFFDLRGARRWVKNNARGRILDLFCYTGSFSIYAAGGGAASVLGIDASKFACELARRNARLNHFDNIEFRRADVFEFLRLHHESYDFIVLDPPSFTKSKSKKADALRGYKEINFQAMKRLKNNGILVTTCCSYHIDEEDFYGMLKKAAIDARVNLRMLARIMQSPDHPVDLYLPESFYLKGFCLLKI